MILLLRSFAPLFSRPVWKHVQVLLTGAMLEAIRAATGRAAVACQLNGVIGMIAPGCVADLLVVKGDPTTDLGVLARPLMAVQGGHAVVDRLR